MTEALLTIKNLNKSFALNDGAFGRTRGQVTAAADISLELRRGETLGLVGESGCGKTTLARIILGLEIPDSGRLIFKGHDLLSITSNQRRALCASLQVIFQDPYGSLNPRRTIGQSVAEPLQIHGRGNRTAVLEQTRALLERVGIEASQFSRYPHQFSGGQRQRIAIARALALRPELLILDEPVSALDVSIQAQVINLLIDLKQEFELTYLFISHDLALVGYLADRVAVMQRGRIVELAASAELFKAARHPYTLSLIAAGRTAAAAQTAGPGCAYAQGCAHVRAACRTNLPELKPCGPDHWVACHAAADK